jgi:8-oxo-dGTP pyrophosphatase MutT (NUDIX family)
VARHLEGVLAHISGTVDRRGNSWWILGGDEELDLVANRLAEGKLIPALTGERYRVLDLATSAVVGSVDRSAVIGLGLRTQGVHLNAFVSHQQDGFIEMWLARRAQAHRQFPGKLDNLVAGGLGVGYSFETALRDEAAEEAGISSAMLEAIRHAGTLTYCFDTDEGLVDSEILVCDLEVSPSFVPQNWDSKVDEFLLVPLHEAERLALEDDSFKFNCGLAVLDFIARHRLLCSQDERMAVVCLLRTHSYPARRYRDV